MNVDGPLGAKLDDLLGRASAAQAAGRLEEAERLTLQVLAARPDSEQGHLLMGVVAGKTGRNEPALHHFEEVLRGNPDSFEALFWLSIVYRRMGDLNKALDFADRAGRIRPSDAFSMNNLGMCLMDLGRLQEAATAFEKAARIRPDMPSISTNLGTVLHRLGRDSQAASAFEKSIRQAPRSLEAYLGLGQVSISCSEPAKAADCARQALVIDPNSAHAHLLLANALAEQGRTVDSEQRLQAALALSPDNPQVNALVGQRLQSAGRFEEANTFLNKSIELLPKQGFAYFALTQNNRITEHDRPLVAKMEEMATDAVLPPREVAFLQYGLGRAYEFLGDYERSMACYDEANRLAKAIKFQGKPFDRKAYAARVDALIAKYPAIDPQAVRSYSVPSETPVLVVGMMRSGTTLVEQILSAHPSVYGGGEQPFWPANASLMLREGAKRTGALAQTYVNILADLAPEAERVIDKMPANYEWLGPIHLALPNARMIHMRRHPVDTCFSIYATPNRVSVGFAHDRENIVFAYKQYLRLIEHWRSILPADRFLEVDYEALVQNREYEARRMTEFIGLDWSDSVLRHELNERIVVTPSQWQVRQPIYATSIERWRKFKPMLGVFEELLTPSDNIGDASVC